MKLTENKGLVAGVALLGATCGVPPFLVVDGKVDRFLYHEDGAEVTCGLLRDGTSLPYDPETYCPPEKDDNEVVRIPGLQNMRAEVMKAVKDLVICIYAPLTTVEFVDGDPEEGKFYNVISMGGVARRELMADGKFSDVAGIAPLDIGNPGHVNNVLINEMRKDGVAFSPREFTLTIAHEVGHALGLDHNDMLAFGEDSIMEKTRASFRFTTQEAEILVKNTRFGPPDDTQERAAVAALRATRKRCAREIATIRTITP